MAKKNKKYSVNWIDGMKVNKDHLIEMENAMISQHHAEGKFLINPYNFGILPPTDSEPSIDVSISISADNHITIRVLRCSAITSGGLIIDLESTLPELPEFEISIKDFDLKATESNSCQYYVILKTNPYGRVPVGNADPGENPPRHPYVIPEYSVHIIPVEQVNKTGLGDFFLVIGKVIIKDNIPALDKDYIPPCSSVSSNEQLINFENRLTGFFSRLEMDMTTIIRKIHTKQQKTPLANSVLIFTDKVSEFQALHMTKYRLYMKYLPPVALFEAISLFACFLRNTLNALPPENKEELINYFSDWCNLKQGEFEKLMTDIPGLNYDHFEIRSVMSKMMNFIDTMSLLFETLSNLDYIGKRRDTQIYIKEEGKQKKSFLADD
jgi:hypothetical protein